MRRKVLLYTSAILGAASLALLLGSYWTRFHVSWGAWDIPQLTRLSCRSGRIMFLHIAGTARPRSDAKTDRLPGVAWVTISPQRMTINPEGQFQVQLTERGTTPMVYQLSADHPLTWPGLEADRLLDFSDIPMPAHEKAFTKSHVFSAEIRGWPWAFPALFAAYPLLASARHLRKHMRRQSGGCTKCDYSLTGNTSGVCPECGTAVELTKNRDGSG